MSPNIIMERKELEQMKKDELLEYASENGVSVEAKDTKEEIINKLTGKSGKKSNAISKLANRNSERGSIRRSYTVKAEDRNKAVISEEDETAAKIRMSMKSNLTLSGRISSVIRAEMRSGTTYLAIIKYGNYKVSIPAQLLIDLRPEDEKDPDRIKKICENRLGSVVDFKVLQEDLEDSIPSAMASRVDAMRIIRKKVWFATTKDDEWRIQEGQIVEGRIVSVVQGGIFVEVAGAETFIPNSELDHVRRFDARELFSVNDETVNVYIQSIERDIENFNVTFRASVKDTKKDQRANTFSMIDDGSVCFGEVRRIIFNKDSDPRVLVWLDQDYPCLCAMLDQIPKQGDYVRVFVRKHENFRISGRILHIERPSR